LPVPPPHPQPAAPPHDGTQIAYVANGGRGGIAVAPLPAKGAPMPAPRLVTSDPSDSTPVFSGDGTTIVFVRSSAGGVTQLYVVPAAGGAARLLGDGEQPATSPVGDTIAFITEADANGARRVMLTDTRGTKPREVPGLEPSSWQRPRFSNDGTKMLLVRGYQEVVEVTLDDSAPPRSLYDARTDGVLFVDYAPGGDGVLAGVADYDGDVWLAEGVFP
jgi:Tol biopolymer transport system component